MIRIGQRQFEIPVWLWVAVPLALMIYALSGASVLLPRFGVPDETFSLIKSGLGFGGSELPWGLCRRGLGGV